MVPSRPVLAAALFGFSFAAQAAVVFSDNFNASVSGFNVAPTGWTVTSGTVDVIGGVVFCVDGLCVDLDGSTNNAGVLSRNFALVGGTPYLLQFDLAGNQRGGTDTVTIGFGTASLVIGVGATNPYSTRSLSFAPATDGVYTVSFSNAGGDNVGALLDNVVITSVDGGGGGGGGSVPEPGSATLALLGLIGLAAAFKRRPG